MTGRQQVKTIGFTWGIGGVLLLLLFAVYRLAPIALDLENSALSTWHWAILLLCIVFMAYAEGYKGFHRAFAPRVVRRASYLRDNPRLLHILLAPLFCMGYIYATRRRKLTSFGVTTMVICFVLVARMLPQPWRGIIDAGVVVGLSMGIASIIYFLIIANKGHGLVGISAEVPGDT